jgi:hypothetical protein
LAVEVDSFVKEGLLGCHPNFRAVMLCPDEIVSNPYLLRTFRGRISVISKAWICILLKPFSKLKALSYDVTRYAQIENGSSNAPMINAQWGEREPAWELTSQCRAHGSITKKW